ncbi:MAG: nucleotidyltransferase family protein, partial [Lachnospiraceae bacterium]|nr:nucleotidyltransferase family protein [Lachnospiraceae bacterium]
MNGQSGEKEEMFTTGLYLLELMKAALLDRKCLEKPDNISWESIYKLAKMHNVEGIMTYGMETLENKPPQELWEQWKNFPKYIMYRGIRFDMEREAIFTEMQRVGLAYLPLKGIHLAGYYPKPGMRMMADNDILFGYVENAADGSWKRSGATLTEQEQKQEEASHVLRQIMKKRGYEEEGRGIVHDVYKKLPMFNFEMHKGLMAATSDFYEYYKDPWKRAIQSTKDTGEYYFSDEDEYIYLLVHAYKHFSNGGCGIRLLADMHVFEDCKGAQLDRKYVKQELIKLGLEGFEHRVTALTKAVFTEQGSVLEQENAEMLDYMLHAGTYGTVENFVQNKIKKLTEEKEICSSVGKLLYIKERIFPNKTWWNENYPI